MLSKLAVIVLLAHHMYNAFGCEEGDEPLPGGGCGSSFVQTYTPRITTWTLQSAARQSCSQSTGRHRVCHPQCIQSSIKSNRATYSSLINLVATLDNFRIRSPYVSII